MSSRSLALFDYRRGQLRSTDPWKSRGAPPMRRALGVEVKYSDRGLPTC